jgi:hypothetical protein
VCSVWESHARAEILLADGQFTRAADSIKQVDLNACPLAMALDSALSDIPSEIRIASLRELVAQWPDLHQPRLYLGVMLSATVNHQAEGKALLRRYAMEFPSDVRALLYLGTSLRAGGNTDEATAAYVEALGKVTRLTTAARIVGRLCRLHQRRIAFGAALRARGMPTASRGELVLAFPILAFDMLSFTLLYAPLALIAIDILAGDRGAISPTLVAISILGASWRFFAARLRGTRRISRDLRPRSVRGSRAASRRIQSDDP